MSTHSDDAQVTRAAALPPEARRAAIIAATVPLVVEHGAATLTTRQIAAAAGVAEGTLFRVFTDKDALLRAVIDAACDPAETEAALRALDPDVPLRDLVSSVVTILQRDYRQAWQVLSAVPPMGEWGAASELPSLVSLLTPHRTALSVPVRRAAKQIAAVTLAMSHTSIYPGGPAAPSEIVDLLMGGLAR